MCTRRSQKCIFSLRRLLLNKSRIYRTMVVGIVRFRQFKVVGVLGGEACLYFTKIERYRTTKYLQMYLQSCVRRLPKYWPPTPVFWIHDILVWVRIRIRESMPLTIGSGFGSGSGSWIRILPVCHWPARCQQKTNFLTQLFLLVTFWRYIYIIFQR
jgi:hypothetical protein